MADLGKLIKLLGSDKDGEVLAAVGALKRALAGEGKDLHHLAARLDGGARQRTEQGPWRQDAVMQEFLKQAFNRRTVEERAFKRGYEEGLKSARVGFTPNEQEYMRGYADGWKKGRATGSAREYPKQRKETS